MCISGRDESNDSLSWPVHALLYVFSRLKELALLSHSQLVAGIVAHILRSAYIFGKRSSSHSLRTLSGVCGLSFFGLSPGQTIPTFQRNISQRCWVQRIACVWPPCCDMLGVGSNLKMVKFFI